METIDENESKYEKESISSRTAREQIQSTTAPPTTTEATNVNHLFFYIINFYHLLNSI